MLSVVFLGGYSIWMYGYTVYECMDAHVCPFVFLCLFRFTTANADPAVNPTYMDHAASPAVNHPHNYGLYPPMWVYSNPLAAKLTWSQCFQKSVHVCARTHWFIPEQAAVQLNSTVTVKLSTFSQQFPALLSTSRGCTFVHLNDCSVANVTVIQPTAVSWLTLPLPNQWYILTPVTSVTIELEQGTGLFGIKPFNMMHITTRQE